MTLTHERDVLAAVLAAALYPAIAFVKQAPADETPTPGYNTKIPPQVMTPGTVQTRIGTLTFADGVPTRAPLYPNSQAAFIGDDYRWLDGDGMSGRNLDARAAYFYVATVTTPAMAAKLVGAGSQYAVNYTDSAGNPLDGAKSYRLS